MESGTVETAEIVEVRRPLGVTLLAVGLFGLAAAALGRTVWMGLNARYLWSLSGPFLTWYLLNSSLPAGLLSPAAGAWLLKGKPAGRILTLVLLGLGTIQYWLDKCILSVNPLGRIDWPFALIFNLLIAGLVLGILLNRRAQRYFREG